MANIRCHAEITASNEKRKLMTTQTVDCFVLGK